MNKKTVLAVGLCVVLLVCSVIYFRPLPLSGCIPENGSLLLHSNTLGVQNGKPYIHSEAYDHITEDQKEKIMENQEQFKSEKASYRYNYLGILGVMCQRSVERRYNYFCSQFVSYVLRKAGISLIMKKPGLTCPRDFRMCDDLEIIYVGKLRNYRNYLKLHFLRDAETGDYIVN